MKKIGMVGIGLMGHGIATNLLKHGHELAVFDHPGNQPLDALRAGGVQVMSDLAALAARSEVLILVLTGSPAVEAVLTGPGGVLEGLRPGTVVIDCSTALPAATQRMAQAVAAAGGAGILLELVNLTTEGAVLSALPAGRLPQALDYSPGQLRLDGLALSPNDVQALASQAQAYSIQVQGPTLSVRARP